MDWSVRFRGQNMICVKLILVSNIDVTCKFNPGLTGDSEMVISEFNSTEESALIVVTKSINQ